MVLGGVSLSSDRDTPATPPATTPARQRLSNDRDAGAVLRTVYQATVEEAVPDEMLDLLGKLS